MESNPEALAAVRDYKQSVALPKQCGVVPDMVDRWHHLILLFLEIIGTESSIHLVR